MTAGVAASTAATTELLVPKSIPTTFRHSGCAIVNSSQQTKLRPSRPPRRPRCRRTRYHSAQASQRFAVLGTGLAAALERTPRRSDPASSRWPACRTPRFCAAGHDGPVRRPGQPAEPLVRRGGARRLQLAVPARVTPGSALRSLPCVLARLAPAPRLAPWQALSSSPREAVRAEFFT